MKLQKINKLKEDIIEIAILVKACLTTFWFWLPPLFAIYMYLQLWMMFFIHPLTLAVLPTILLIYALVDENKRLKAMYGLDSIKKKSALDPIGSPPLKVKGFRWDIEKALEKYKQTLKKKEKDDKTKL